VLVDQPGRLESLIDSALDRDYQEKVLAALNEYAGKYAAAPGKGEGGPPGEPLKDFAEGNPQAVQNFISKGGQAFFLEQLRPRLNSGAPAFKAPRRLFQRDPLPAGIDGSKDLETVAEGLKPYLRGDQQIVVDGQSHELSAAILIPRDLDEQIVRPGKTATRAAEHPIQYWSANASESALRDEIERVVNTEVRRREFLARGLDRAAVEQVQQTYAPFTSLNPKKEKGQEAINKGDVIRQWAPSGFVYLLWLSIFVIVQMLLNNVIEEKSNRIIEVLLSSVTPGELMMGKLFGIAAVGLTMVCVWLVALFGIVSWKAGGASDFAGQMLTVLRTSNLLPLFCVYFLLGYLMYAAFILSIGSVCNTIKEAQSYMGILTMVLMAPLLTMTYIPRDPNGPLARLLSWIPIYTPFTMMNRANADPPLVDLLGTLLLLIGTASLALWMTGKIFRIGILRTGQPPKIIEMLRWAMRREG
jgi:ABC-2 type transport system permease protein